MAAEVVGGALLSAFLQVAFDRLASPQFVDFFRGRKLDEKLLGNLNIMLHSINALADDAEHKQFTDPHVKAWLLSVKEAVLDAEDLLGEIDYELTRCQVEAGSEPQTFTYKVSTFFNSTFSSFNKKIESEMKEVLEKLKYLEQQKDALGLKNGTSYSDSKVSQKLPSSSLVVERSLTDAKRMRSFLPIRETATKSYHYKLPCQFKTLIHELFSKLNFLRVLSLDGYSDLREVPDSVGDLKHLHSLDLSRTYIQKLPESISVLYNLLILKLNGCSYLEELPSNLHKLTKLHCLEFEDTKVTKMPLNFEELKNLHVLNMFLVDRNGESSVKQLGGLNLHGKLSINEVQNIVNPLDALEANLKDKHLVELQLDWKSNHVCDDSEKEKKVLENLQPSKHLEQLSIKNYGGTQLPSWVFNNSLSNLVFLRLKSCKYCVCLPSLGLLSSLKTLEIIGLKGISSIGVEFYGSNSSFMSLETLNFIDMKEWEEWECKTTSFPRLQHLFVNRCPKLKGLSNQLLHLKHLVICYCDKLIISETNMDTRSLEFLKLNSCPLVSIPTTHYNLLKEMSIDDGCDSLTTFSLDFFPNLCYLYLRRCRNLQRISQEDTHNHLQRMTIAVCPQFESFPSEGLSAPQLVSFEIFGAQNLKCENPPSLPPTSQKTAHSPLALFSFSISFSAFSLPENILIHIQKSEILPTVIEFRPEARSRPLPQAEPSLPTHKSICIPPLSSNFRILGCEIEVSPLLKESLLVEISKVWGASDFYSNLIWTLACGNRFVIWYFRLGEWLSPERKHQKTHPCSCAKSRLGELRSLKQEPPSFKRTSLA
ncbi:disease resistance protein RPM1 [Vigna unguiculata]|uniref:Disease resistance protein RPM1 n=1 Tax=Vigna unguiculata TaxID=3917 RepID=A0A4D6M3U7_VIGUN|nr:disease resistance protein RPM1 [Vigna unguiculata]